MVVYSLQVDPAPVKTKTAIREKVVTKIPEPLPDIEEMHTCNPEGTIIQVT